MALCASLEALTSMAGSIAYLTHILLGIVVAVWTDGQALTTMKIESDATSDSTLCAPCLIALRTFEWAA